jgi:hypothetical protein
MLSALVVGFCLIAFLLFFLFLCICISGVLGVLKFFTPFLSRAVADQHDQIYRAQADPINSDCYFCLERVSNEVVTTCNHSFCGTLLLSQGTASSSTSEPMGTGPSTAPPAVRKF